VTSFSPPIRTKEKNDFLVCYNTPLKSKNQEGKTKLGFLIETTLISIGSELQAGNPRRCLAHQFTDGVQGCLHRDFEDHLIVNMRDDSVFPQALHSFQGFCGAVHPADSLIGWKASGD